MSEWCVDAKLLCFSVFRSHVYRRSSNVPDAPISRFCGNPAWTLLILHQLIGRRLRPAEFHASMWASRPTELMLWSEFGNKPALRVLNNILELPVAFPLHFFNPNHAARIQTFQGCTCAVIEFELKPLYSRQWWSTLISISSLPYDLVALRGNLSLSTNDATPLIAKDKLISFWCLCLPVAIATCPFYLDDLYPLWNEIVLRAALGIICWIQCLDLYYESHCNVYHSDLLARSNQSQ